MTEPSLTPPERQQEAAEFAAGLREFADWLEERSWLPTRRGGSNYPTPARIQVDLNDHAGLDQVREIAQRLGVDTYEEMNDRTSVEVAVGSVSYAVIAWHPDGRPAAREALQ